MGRAIAWRLAADGDTIICLGRNLPKLEAVVAELGGASFAVACDVAKPDSVRAAFAKIVERHPKIDVLINNAAVFTPFWIKNATDAQIEASLTTNFGGPIYCSRAVIPMMEKTAISSMSAVNQ